MLKLESSNDRGEALQHEVRSLIEGGCSNRGHHRAFSSAMNALHYLRRSMRTRLATPQAHKIWPIVRQHIAD